MVALSPRVGAALVAASAAQAKLGGQRVTAGFSRSSSRGRSAVEDPRTPRPVQAWGIFLPSSHGSWSPVKVVASKWFVRVDDM